MDSPEVKSDISEETYNHFPEYARRQAPPIFRALSIKDNCKVPDEPLHVSVDRYAGQFNLNTDGDSLFKVDNGRLAGRFVGKLPSYEICF